MLAMKKIDNWFSEEIDEDFNDITEDFDAHLLEEAEIKKSRLTRKQILDRDLNTMQIHMNRINSDLSFWWDNHKGMFKWGLIGAMVVYAIVTLT
ncbi:hypothetical protein [Burkholderia contaminans]|uniref:hypothetical protein n=1 Tax=Burkholderia contaminans TaxID=488447 RepID=UPI00158E15A2|nr:hypothetical protein [Burkholderia contaminans]